jgi:acyl-CoA synthetase (AMP-forming)/AMP-acid ligase II
VYFHEPLEYWASRRPDSAYSVGDIRLTYAEAADLAAGWSARWSAAGIGTCDRIGLIAGNDPRVPLLIAAASRIGAVIVPVNPALLPRDQVHMLASVGVAALVCSPRFAPALFDAGAGDVSASRRFVLDGRPAVGVRLDPGDDAVAIPAARTDRNNVILQPFTSGTTGSPKSPLLTHEVLSTQSSRWTMAGLRLEPGETLYLPMPITLWLGASLAYHTMWCGAALQTEQFSVSSLVRAITQDRVAATVMVPTILHMLLDELGPEPVAHADLKWILYGAAPIPPSTLRRALTTLRCAFFQGYGSTESTAMTMLFPEDHLKALDGQEQLLRSVGRPFPGSDVMILTDDLLPAAANEVGEICSKGRHLFDGYHNDPERTAERFHDGWYRTGDLGFLDEQGYLYLLDRKDNLIISGGANIYPADIEAVLTELDGVHEVAVFGLPDLKWGQAVTAAIVAKPGWDASEEAVHSFCAERLPSFKRPKRIVFVDDLPRNANGKVQHFALRERFS